MTAVRTWGLRAANWLGVLWAAPCTLAAIGLALLLIPSGVRLYRHRRVVVCCGGGIAWLLRRVPVYGGAAAMTIGHAVLARDEASLDRCYEHELVHVRQYQWWGVFFIPAYLIASIGLALLGRDPYRDNPFERQAFDEDRRRRSPPNR